ncbi:MAG: redoxin domain-containing protein [Bacteroidota bacterium]
MRFLSLVFFSFIFFFSNAEARDFRDSMPAKNGYYIPVTITPYKNAKIYIGTYYGKNKTLVDSCMLNEKSQGLFSGDKKLDEGIYFLVSPQRTLLFEILMDSAQHFSIKTDSSRLADVITEGSAENKLFADYSRFLTSVAPKINALQSDMKHSAKNKKDSTAIMSQIKKLSDDMNTYRNNIVQQHPESMLAVLFEAVKVPAFPPMPVKPDGTKDSSYPWQYVKDHFWDNVNFYDGRLLHTPFFDSKINDYLDNYISQQPDSVIEAVNYMLLSSRSDEQMFHYLLAKFTDRYINPEIMGQDKVFLFLFNNYFSKGDTSWLNASQKKYIFDRAYSLIANQLGDAAPQLDLVDSTGKLVSLYATKAPFTFVIFWDPLCSHCQEQVPELDSLYEAKWKALGVKIFAVNTNENTKPDWEKFITDHHLNGWLHAWQTREARLEDEQTGRPNFRQLFDITQTPTTYLLDENKKIIAKKLSIDQYDQIIESKLKKNTP